MNIPTLTSRIKLCKSLFSSKMTSKLRIPVRPPQRRAIQSTKAVRIKISASTKSMNQSRTWRYPIRQSGKQ